MPFWERLVLCGGAGQALEILESAGKGRGTQLLDFGCTTGKLMGGVGW